MSVRKVLHVIPSVGPLRGGPSEMVRQLARSLVKAGVETHVVTTDDNGPGTLPVPHGEPVLQDGVTYWYFRRQVRFYTISLPLSAWLAGHVHEFDLVHIHALFSFASLPAAYWASRHGVPYIVRPLGTLNDWGMRHRRPWLKRASFRMLESRVLAGAALVHYTSDQERREAETLGVTGACAVIPNALPAATPGIAAALFGRYPQLIGRRVVLFLSRIDRKKGLDLLLQAFAVAVKRTPDAILVIAGEGDEALTRELKSASDSLGISADVLWTGFLTGPLKSAAFAAASIYVLPSHSENFGIAVIEAMAAGLPVVISDQVGISDAVESESAGIVVRLDVGELTEALIRLLGDDELATRLGERAARLAAIRYSEAGVTTDVIGAYNRVAGLMPC